jgi:hypothetical protein
MSTLKPTEEQQQILDAFDNGQRLVIDAAAGSGKTSTLRMLAAMTHGTCAYLAYNRAIKEDAAASFPTSVACMTSHGMAYGPVATRYRHRLGGPRIPAQRVAQILGIREPARLSADLPPLSPQQLARIAVATVGRFCHSADDEVTARHIPVSTGLELPPERAALAQAVLPYARKAWADIQNEAGQLRFEHDHYLKIFQLGLPVLSFDVLFVDEAQDLNPVVQAIVGYQTDAQVVLVGDRCQQLYAWRGAVDAMSTFDGRRLALTQSFRFGDAIADEANKWLSILRADIRVRGLASIPSVVGDLAEPAAVLCRTNGAALSRVLDAAAAGRRPALVGRVGKDIASLARAARDLQAGRGCDHPELLAFSSWHEVRTFVALDESASDLRLMVDLIDKHGPDRVLGIVEHLVSEDAADVVVSTAHGAKGREWSSVAVATDFREPKPLAPGVRGEVERADAMLAYVTVTRAKLQLDREGLAWVDRYVPAGRPAPAPAPEHDDADVVEPGPDGTLLSLYCLRCTHPWQECTCALMPERHSANAGIPQDEYAALVRRRIGAVTHA